MNELKWLLEEAKMRLKLLKIPINEQTLKAVAIGAELTQHRFLEKFDQLMLESGYQLRPQAKIIRKQLIEEDKL